MFDNDEFEVLLWRGTFRVFIKLKCCCDGGTFRVKDFLNHHLCVGEHYIHWDNYATDIGGQIIITHFVFVRNNSSFHHMAPRHPCRGVMSLFAIHQCSWWCSKRISSYGAATPMSWCEVIYLPFISARGDGNRVGWLCCLTNLVLCTD